MTRLTPKVVQKTSFFGDFFKRISKLMIVHLVASAIFWINAFPPSTPGAGLSDTKGPRQLILGNTVDYKKVCRLQPGEYVQVY